MATTSAEAGSEALRHLKSTDPPQWLAPSSTLSQMGRAASQHLFSSLMPYTPKSPFDKLLVEGFDAEQIWQQIDLQSQPLISSISRELKRFEKDPEEIRKLKVVVEGEEKTGLEDEREKMEVESDGFGEDMDGFDEEIDDDEEEEEEEEEEDEEGKCGNNGGGIEDQFLKLKDLEEFMEDDEAREYGLKKKDNKKNKVDDEDQEEGSEDEGEEEDEEDSDEVYLGKNFNCYLVLLIIFFYELFLSV